MEARKTEVSDYLSTIPGLEGQKSSNMDVSSPDLGAYTSPSELDYNNKTISLAKGTDSELSVCMF